MVTVGTVFARMDSVYLRVDTFKSPVRKELTVDDVLASEELRHRFAESNPEELGFLERYEPAMRDMLRNKEDIICFEIEIYLKSSASKPAGTSKWYSFDGRKFVKITYEPQGAMEPLGESFEHPPTSVSIFQDAAVHLQRFPLRYGLVRCCGQVHKITFRGRSGYCPSCRKLYSVMTDLEKAFREGDNGMVSFSSEAELEMNRPRVSPERRVPDAVAVTHYFFGRHSYGFNSEEALRLHKSLSRKGSPEKLFRVTEYGSLDFEASYRRYLEGLSANGVLMDRVEEALGFPGRFFGEVDLDRAFYSYMHECWIEEGTSKLIYTSRGTQYTFDTVREYVDTLLSAPDDKVAEIRGIFNPSTCSTFFRDYSAEESELSRMIHEVSGEFVVFGDDCKLIRLGRNYLKEMHLRDESLPDRYRMLLLITSNTRFINRVGFTGYYSALDEDGYDMLCYYQSTVNKGTLRYNGLLLRDSELSDGALFEICKIIVGAYRDGASSTRYLSVVDLFDHSALWEPLALGKSWRTDKGFTDTQPFHTLATMMDREKVTMDAYLYASRILAAQSGGGAIEFVYGGVSSSVNGHFRSILSRVGKGAGIADLIKFLRSRETESVLKTQIAVHGLDAEITDREINVKLLALEKALENADKKFQSISTNKNK